MKQIIKYTAVILTTLAALYILWQFKLILLLFVLSLFVAITIRPFVDAMVDRGIPRAAAQLLFYVVGVGSFLLALLLIGELLLQELNVAVNQVVLEYETLVRQWQLETGWQHTAVAYLPPPFTSTAAQETELQEMAPAVVAVTRSVTGALGGLLLLLALTVYWSADQHRFERLWLSLLPAKRRAYARDIWRDIEIAMGRYLRSQIVQSLLAFLFLAVGAAVIGIDYPLLLALVGALAAFVPIFGGLLAALVGLALGGLQSWSIGLVTAGYCLLVFIGLELIVEPRLWPRKRRSFLLTILLILPLFEAVGFWGLLMAPPLAAALEVVGGHAYQASVAQRDTAVQLASLEARYHELVQKVSGSEPEGITPELQDLNRRLADLLADSRLLEQSRQVNK